MAALAQGGAHAIVARISAAHHDHMLRQCGDRRRSSWQYALGSSGEIIHGKIFAVGIHAVLMAAVAEDDAGQQAMTETQPEPEQEQPVAGQTTIRVLIESSGGKVNIRAGNGTSYSRMTAVAPGTTLEYVASTFNGWQAVKIGSQVGWVSGEYSEITTA